MTLAFHLIAVAALFLLPASLALVIGPKPRGTIDLENFLNDTVNVRWHHASNKLFVGRVSPDRYWNIYTCNLDGSNMTSITYLNPLLTGRNAGAHALSPDGRFLIFQAEKRDHPCPPGRNFSEVPPMDILGCSFECLPGFGGFSDIWAINLDGSKAWLLYTTPNTADYAILLPQISHDGTKVAWSERYLKGNTSDPAGTAGYYKICLADLTVNSTGDPTLTNVQSWIPDNVTGFYEVSDFTPDDTKLIVTGNYASRDFGKSQLFFFDTGTGSMSAPLTPGNCYSEHPHALPDGEHIMYMSSCGDNSYTGTDFWLMDINGSNLRQLTFMNKVPDSQTGVFSASITAGDSYGWAADSSFVYASLQSSVVTQTGLVRRVYMPPTRFANDYLLSGKSAYVVWDPSNGNWSISDGASDSNTSTTKSYTLGSTDDIPLRSDFNGKYTPVPSIFTPSTATYTIFGGTSYAVGQSGDVPVPADYDGDGKADAIVYRPSSGEWFGRLSGLDFSFGEIVLSLGGQPGDIPFSCDFDGDGKSDLGIFRNSTAPTSTWLFLKSSTCAEQILISFGNTSHIPVPSDYSGYGKCTPATFDLSTSTWNWLAYPKTWASHLVPGSRQWGAVNAVPVPGLDVDGDGRSELTSVEVAWWDPQYNWVQHGSGIGYNVSWFFGIQTLWGKSSGLPLPLHATAVFNRARKVPPPQTPSPVPPTPTKASTPGGPTSCFSSSPNSPVSIIPISIVSTPASTSPGVPQTSPVTTASTPGSVNPITITPVSTSQTPNTQVPIENGVGFLTMPFFAMIMMVYLIDQAKIL